MNLLHSKIENEDIYLKYKNLTNALHYEGAPPRRNVMEIGEVIARGRKAAGLKQKELAAAAGVHVQTLKRLEKGAGAGYATVRALEKALAENGVSWREGDDGFELRVVLRRGA